jgi:predicted TIM-barrel fold metal-dependent hydrolase
MAGILDADTHIIEPREMWEDFDKEFYHRRPVVVSAPDDTLYKPRKVFWLIDGNIFPKGAGKGGANLATPMDEDTRASRPESGAKELLDIDYRLRDMDAMDVQTQVVYPTLFLVYLTDDPGLDVALCQAYNRFLARAYEKSLGRIRWVVIPPLRSIDASIKELKWAKEHGAVGVFFRGLEGDLSLDDPYFFPVYEAASNLDLPICIHTGAGSPSMTAIFDVTRSRTFPHVRIPPLMAFRNLVANNIPEMFPKLRFGFVETGASWVPYVLKALKRGGNPETRVDSWGPEMFKSLRLYVSYEIDEDLPYLINFIGEDNLILGTDYGHHGNLDGRGGDQSAQPQMIAELRAREELSGSTLDKLLIENPRRFYGLPD